MNDIEDIKREHFCQIIGEIYGSDEYLIVGIDVAKEKHHAFMGTATGKTLYRRLIFENSRSGFVGLLEQVELIRSQNSLKKVVFAVEPTGNYHKPLSRFLVDSGSHLVLVTGKAVKNNREVLDGRWDKHDTKDAANVADLASRGRCQYYDRPSEKIVEMRDLLSLRRRLKKDEHGIRVRIRNTVLAKYFPELDKYFDTGRGEILSIVKWCPNPVKIADMPFDRFFRMVTKRERGIAQKLRLRKIHQSAGESIGCPMGEAAEFEAKLLVDKLNQVRQDIGKVEKRIKEIGEGFAEYRYLLTIPGYGPYVSSVVLSAIADPFRFDNASQVIKLSGYDLCADRSGQSSDKAVPVISKRGSGELRYALYQAAQVASVKNRYFKVYFTGLLQGRQKERGIHTKMRVKLAAKMLVIAWVMMKRKEVFDPGRLNIG
ncbi:MAG: IS110 family transposase [Desulfobacterales bacterium]|nr:IS110 family transposase [Desulfobacterales bacterium]